MCIEDTLKDHFQKFLQKLTYHFLILQVKALKYYQLQFGWFHNAYNAFKDIDKYHRVIHETDLANNFQVYYKKSKNKLSKQMQSAIARGMKYSAKEYLDAVDFMKRSYESYKEVFEDYHGVLSPCSTGVADKGLKDTGSADFNRVWSYMHTPAISLPLLQGENNLPLGVQLVGDKYGDLRFLSTARWLEQKSKEFNE